MLFGTAIPCAVKCRKNMGTVEDFLLTSMSSQLDSLQFIKEGSTRRKEILAKFLDLEVFEKKFRYAKEDSADLKALLRRFANRQFDEELEELRKDIGLNRSELEAQQEICDNFKSDLETQKLALAEVNEKIESIPLLVGMKSPYYINIIFWLKK